jgi:methyl-accepting chemotaxis protein
MKKVLARLSPTIFQKMLITMLLVALVPLSVIWYIDYRDAMSRISATIDQQLADASNKLVSHVNDWVTMNLKVLNQNAAVADMTSMDAKKQNPLLQTILNEYRWSYLVFTIGPDGMNIGRSDSEEPKNYADRGYFTDVMNGQPMGKQVVISKTTNKPSLIVSAPIKGTGFQPRGVIAMGMSIGELSERITNLRIGKTGFAFLLDETGKVVAHQSEGFADKMADFSKHPAFVGRDPAARKQLVYDDNGREVIAYVQPTAHGWYMVAQQDHAEAFAPIRRANQKALVLLALTFAGVTLIAYWFSQALTNPIRNLTHVADEMSRGRVVVKIDEISRNDEIGSLARAIDRMGTSIKLAIERLSKTSKVANG